MDRTHRVLRPGKGLVSAESTVDPETASAALDTPERTVVLPETPLVGDPRAAARRPRSRIEASAAAGRVRTARLRDAGTIGLPRERETSTPAAERPAPPTHDDRTAAWFAALLPAEARAQADEPS